MTFRSRTRVLSTTALLLAFGLFPPSLESQQAHTLSYGEPEDVGNACLYLASPLASYVSGSNLLVHGGGEKPTFLKVAKNTAEQKQR